MLKQIPKNIKKYILLEFTKELIKNTKTYNEILTKKEVKLIIHQKPEEPPKEIIKVQELKEKGMRKVIKDKIERDSTKVDQLKKEIENPFADFFKIKKKTLPQRLIIPDPLLPQTVSHIRPTPIQKEIDLGKINPLIQDPWVNIIECIGAGEKIIVTGKMGRKNTPIILNSQEIKGVISKFSESTKIPVHEGLNKIVFGRLILHSIFSEITNSKFIISKMPIIHQQQMHQQYSP